MSHRGGNDLPRDPMGEKVGQRPALGTFAGETGDQMAVLPFQGLYRKGYRLADSGEDGDVPGGTLGNAKSGILPGDIARKRAYGHF